MPIFGQYQGGDPFQVGPNMQNYIAGERNVQTALIEGIDKFNQSLQEMDTLRSTTGSILSQFPTDETGKPSPAAPKYVHDLYKSVEKEGGIQGLSKSSLIAALKGYETGFQVEAQQFQVRQAQQAETLKGFEIEKAKREADEARRIALAHKLAMESLGTPSGRVETATAPTLATDMPADMGNEIYKYYTGQRSTDPREGNAKPTVAQPTPTTAKASPTTKKPAEKSKTLEQKVNPETAERDALEAKLNQARANETVVELEAELERATNELAKARSPNSSRGGHSSAGMSGFYAGGALNTPIQLPASKYSKPMEDIPKGLDEIRADKEKEKVLIPRIDSLKKQIAELKTVANKPLPEAKPKPAGATPVTPASSVTNPSAEDVHRIGSNFLKNNPPSKWSSRLEVLREEVARMETMFGFDRNNKTQVFYNANFEETERPEYTDFVKMATELTELEAVKSKYDTFKSIPNIDKPYVAPTPKDEINPAFLPTAVPESVAPKATSKPISKAKPTVKPSQTAQQPQPQAVNYRPELKSDDEKISEEYGQLTSRLRALDGVPLNWSEDTYRQMRGYPPKIKVVQQGGFALVGIGDKWQVIKTGGENQMSPSELASHEKHLMLKSAIRTDNMSTKKWSFRGDIRTTETDTAGKVKKSTLDTTRALDALDKLIEAGQDIGFWDSVTPNERSGLIEGVTNSVQAAGRTEIAGSGAFSEQDAKKLESIVPSLATISGAAFKESTLSKLKTYRERMAQQVKDIGRTWGFEVNESTDTGLTQEQQAIMRSNYQEFIKQGYSHEDAKRLAIESLSQ